MAQKLIQRKKAHIIVRHTVWPRTTCPFCRRINDRDKVDYCRHLLTVKKESHSLKQLVENVPLTA